MINAEQNLIERIRAGDERAWRYLIDQYSGRLHAYFAARISDQNSIEDLVQETLIGFLTSLPNFDVQRPIEGFLFGIAAHKLTDALRKQGRRPTLLSGPDQAENPLSSRADRRQRGASTLARSRESRNREEELIASVLQEFAGHWKSRQEWERLMCLELLFVKGLANQKVAQRLEMTEVEVSNLKSYFLEKLRKHPQLQNVQLQAETKTD